MKKCNCLEQVQEHLAKDNACLVTKPFINMKTGEISGFGIMLQVEKLDKKKRSPNLPWVACKFCPFCGNRLQK